ncbi:hypothetical protein [Parerythrobacter aestuarii]|uniref:hypothetical protein n=1 Tax=Parerythrobacter aestuarii TaxID=3020909 RepID=UPI0024DE3A40|nr:hypothetical protein [Parerythrobacter aestuarii]
MARRKRLPAKTDAAKEGNAPDPATNLIMADIALRAGSYLLRSAVERSMLRGRYGKDVAKDVLQNRSVKQNLAAFAAAKVATRSVPGAAIVGGGIALKKLFDLSQQRRLRLSGQKAEKEQAGED